jgi:hypothetical protein
MALFDLVTLGGLDVGNIFSGRAGLRRREEDEEEECEEG